MSCSQPNKENVVWSIQLRYIHTQKSIGWRMEKCIEANPFVGATGIGTELLWKVTPVHCCIELCWIGNKIWHLSIKDGLFPPNFNWPILQIFWTIGRVSFILGTRRYLKRFSSALIRCVNICNNRIWRCVVTGTKHNVRQFCYNISYNFPFSHETFCKYSYFRIFTHLLRQ